MTADPAASPRIGLAALSEISRHAIAAGEGDSGDEPRTSRRAGCPSTSLRARERKRTRSGEREARREVGVDAPPKLTPRMGMSDAAARKSGWRTSRRRRAGAPQPSRTVCCSAATRSQPADGHDARSDLALHERRRRSGSTCCAISGSIASHVCARRCPTLSAGARAGVQSDRTSRPTAAGCVRRRH